MPIKPENKGKYPSPKEWAAIRARILARANNRCEFCGVPNYAIGYRGTDGNFYSGVSCVIDEGDKPIRIVLTIAHLDQDETNNADENLRALCQRCHNRHDMPTRMQHRRETMAKNRAAKDAAAGQDTLPFDHVWLPLWTMQDRRYVFTCAVDAGRKNLHLLNAVDNELKQVLNVQFLREPSSMIDPLPSVLELVADEFIRVKEEKNNDGINAPKPVS